MKKTICLLLLLGILAGFLSGCNKETPFSQDSEPRDHVYVDIIAIKPAYSIGSYSYASDTVCKARTAQGETVWIYMSYEEYSKYFDPSADLGSSLLDASQYDVCVISTRVHGIVWSAGQVTASLSTEIGCDKVIHLSSASAAEFDTGTASALTADVFSQESEELQMVYAQVNAINNTEWLYSGGTMNWQTMQQEYTEEDKVGCLVECTTAEGDSIYLYIPVDQYTDFVTDFKYASKPAVIYGCARSAEDFSSSVAKEIDSTMIISYTHIG